MVHFRTRANDCGPSVAMGHDIRHRHRLYPSTRQEPREETLNSPSNRSRGNADRPRSNHIEPDPDALNISLEQYIHPLLNNRGREPFEDIAVTPLQGNLDYARCLVVVCRGQTCSLFHIRKAQLARSGGSTARLFLFHRNPSPSRSGLVENIQAIVVGGLTTTQLSSSQQQPRARTH